MPSAAEAQSLAHWTAREVLMVSVLFTTAFPGLGTKYVLCEHDTLVEFHLLREYHDAGCSVLASCSVWVLENFISIRFCFLLTRLIVQVTLNIKLKPLKSGRLIFITHRQCCSVEVRSSVQSSVIDYPGEGHVDPLQNLRIMHMEFLRFSAAF